MSTTNVLNNLQEVTSAERLTFLQAEALFHLVRTFRPDWADWKTFMRLIQDTANYTDLAAHEIASHVITAAGTEPSRRFEDLAFLGTNPHQDEGS